METRFHWPLTAEEAKRFLRLVQEELFPQVWQETLAEWVTMRQKLKLTTLSQRAMSRLSGKLSAIHEGDQLLASFGRLAPSEACAALHALRACEREDAPNLVLVAEYQSDQDWEDRATLVILQQAVKWAESERNMFEIGEFLGHREPEDWWRG